MKRNDGDFGDSALAPFRTLQNIEVFSDNAVMVRKAGVICSYKGYSFILCVFILTFHG